jgi:hypothetical protein
MPPKPDDMYDIVCKDRLDRIDGVLDKIWNRIDGNGNRGIVEEIAVLQTKESNREEREARVTKALYSLAVVVVAEVIIGVLVLVF